MGGGASLYSQAVAGVDGQAGDGGAGPRCTHSP